MEFGLKLATVKLSYQQATIDVQWRKRRKIDWPSSGFETRFQAELVQQNKYTF